MHSAHHALCRELVRPRLQFHAAFGHHEAQQLRHRVCVGGMTARVGQITFHIRDARFEPRLDLIGAQSPEPVLHGPHVQADVILHAFGESANFAQIR
jgi:hypothetical protein